MKKKSKKTDYKAKDIYVLEGLEPVRRRPGMYIGSTGTQGLHHLIFECCDNSVDEFIMGYGDTMEVALLSDNKVEVADNGRGIPVEIHSQTKKSALETVMTYLHAGGKFGGKVYKATGGLHGVGVSVVCALSKWMKAEVCRDGKRYEQEYAQGKAKTKVKAVGKCAQTGTKITFEPDPEIFEKIEFSWKKILKQLREQAYLAPGLKIRVQDKRKKPIKKYTFYFEGGIRSFLDYLMEGEKRIQENVFYVKKDIENIKVEVAFCYNDGIETEEVCYANTVPTPEGGTHLTGFRSALTRVLQNWGKQQKILNDKEKIEGEDAREGLTAIVSIKLPDPQFEGQTKQKLGNPEARSVIESVIYDALPDFLEKNPRDGRAIINKCLLAAKSRKAAKAAKESVLRKGIIEGLTLPGKLTDCSSRDPKKSELFIVEGESAGGCFSGNTKVALTDGRNLTFKELIKEEKEGKRNYCYTIKEDGKIGIGLIQHPRKTRKNEKVIKVILDNNKEIVCTPDHLFMLRNRSYKKAKNLSLQDSLMPLYRKHSKIKGKIKTKDYKMVYVPKDHEWIFTHLLADKYYREKISTKIRDLLNKRAKKQRKDRRLLKRRSKKTKEQWVSELRIKRKKTYNQIYQQKDFQLMREIFEGRGFFDKEKYNQERIKRKDKSILRIATICQRFFKNNEEKLENAFLKYNHKIKKIIKLKKRIDVYDLEVEKTHNFALASGVFVHNSSRQARDRRFQAILPLRGKILNVEKVHLNRILSSQEIKSLIISLGTAVADDFNISKLRYHKIIIMADSDVDGRHITTLLLTLFYRYFKDIIESGYLYIAQSPLYRIQAGKEIKYAYTDQEKEKILDKFKGRTVSIQRYKGLGEMNPDQLWETTMDPENRVLKQITIEDAKEADRIFDILMGKEVLPRKKFIQTYAKEVRNLDI